MGDYAERPDNWQGNKSQGTWEKKPYNGPRKKKVAEVEIPELYKAVALFTNQGIPEEVKERAREVAKILEEHEFTLRTDTTSEIDDIFQSAITRKEIYLPWKDFKGLDSPNYWPNDASKEVAKRYFPRFDEMKDTVKAFLSRNVRMVLGQKLKSNICLLIVWTADGAEKKVEKTVKTGLSAHGMSVAFDMKVPVFNLQHADVASRLKHYLEI